MQCPNQPKESQYHTTILQCHLANYSILTRWIVIDIALRSSLDCALSLFWQSSPFSPSSTVQLGGACSVDIWQTLKQNYKFSHVTYLDNEHWTDTRFSYTYCAWQWQLYCLSSYMELLHAGLQETGAFPTSNRKSALAGIWTHDHWHVFTWRNTNLEQILVKFRHLNWVSPFSK
jgi:hypothetical protein